MARPRLAIPLAALTLCALALPALAQQPAAKAKDWATVLGRDTLSRAHLGVLGKAVRVEPLPGHGVSVLVIRVEETLHGELPPGATEVSAVRAEQGAPAEKDKRVVAFLRRLRSSWQVVGLFFVDGDEGKARLALLRRHLALERQAPGPKRDAAHRSLILEGLDGADDDWEFSLYCGELYKRMQDRRGRLDPTFRRDVSRLAFRLARASRADELRTLLRLLPPPRAGARRSPRPTNAVPLVDEDGNPLVADEALAQLARATDDDRAARLRDLGRWRGPAVRKALLAALDGDRLAERRAAAFALGQLRDPATVGRLTAAVAADDAELARLAVRALGLLRAPAAVDAIARRLPRALGRAAARPLADECLLALGRIGGVAAQRRLLDVAATAADAGQRRLAAYCASGALRR